MSCNKSLDAIHHIHTWPDPCIYYYVCRRTCRPFLQCRSYISAFALICTRTHSHTCTRRGGNLGGGRGHRPIVPPPPPPLLGSAHRVINGRCIIKQNKLLGIKFYKERNVGYTYIQSYELSMYQLSRMADFHPLTCKFSGVMCPTQSQ